MGVQSLHLQQTIWLLSYLVIQKQHSGHSYSYKNVGDSVKTTNWAKLTALITLNVLLHLETVTQTKMQIYSNNFLNALAFFVFSRSVIGLGKWTLFNIYSSIACFCARLLMQIFSVTDRQTLSYKTVCFLFNVNHSKMNTVKLKWSCNTAEETEGNTMWRTNQRANCVVS